MKSKKRFTEDLLAAIHKEKNLGIQAGNAPHRVIAIWGVVVEGRVFIRSWGIKPGGWYRTLVADPQAVLHVGGRAIRVRAVQTRSERLKDAVSLAYKEKYDTPGSVQYVKDLSRKKSRDTTTELAPS